MPYICESGGEDNRAAISRVEADPTIISKIQKVWTRENIVYHILHSHLTDSMFLNLSAAIGYSDKLPVPIRQDEANLMWFMLCNNYFLHVRSSDEEGDGKPMRIKTCMQGKILYDLYGGDWTLIKQDPQKSNHKWTKLEAHFDTMFPGLVLSWSIPIAFYRNEQGQSVCTLSGLNYAEVSVCGDTYRIPRKLFVPFFKDAAVHGRVTGPDSDAIKSAFNATLKHELTDVLQYVGMAIKSGLKHVELPIGNVFLQNGHVILQPRAGHEPSDPYWREVGQFYALLPDLEYVPELCDGDAEHVNIWS